MTLATEMGVKNATAAMSVDAILIGMMDTREIQAILITLILTMITIMAIPLKPIAIPIVTHPMVNMNIVMVGSA
ncbi:unnamed protein product [Candidatus Protochlamydia amoebophila UWE25]|uniref:Uncharacterized protein n=1 Tax=Protochlamydia amoebophila (strain UWE25) TaxID=264201 RepID=A0A2P9HA10_PARUW|nr:unnamed protein product [Candidatus Protochlamydia amoebophila UWE25]